MPCHGTQHGSYVPQCYTYQVVEPPRFGLWEGVIKEGGDCVIGEVPEAGGGVCREIYCPREIAVVTS